MIEQEHETFRLPFSEVSTLPAIDALEKIRISKRIRLGDLKLFDLILENGEPTSIWHGVYLFFSEEGECLYVGKNGSQNFIERIPWHFALHEKAWMNHLLKYLRRSKKLVSLGQAALAAKNCTLLLIPVEDKEWESIAPLEKFLRVFLEPKFNTFSKKYRERYRNLNLSESVADVLKKI